MSTDYLDLADPKIEPYGEALKAIELLGDIEYLDALLQTWYLSDKSLDKLLVRSISNGGPIFTTSLLKAGANPSYNGSEALKIAVKNRNLTSFTELVKFGVSLSPFFVKDTNGNPEYELPDWSLHILDKLKLHPHHIKNKKFKIKVQAKEFIKCLCLSIEKDGYGKVLGRIANIFDFNRSISSDSYGEICGELLTKYYYYYACSSHEWPDNPMPRCLRTFLEHYASKYGAPF